MSGLEQLSKLQPLIDNFHDRSQQHLRLVVPSNVSVGYYELVFIVLNRIEISSNTSVTIDNVKQWATWIAYIEGLAIDQSRKLVMLQQLVYKSLGEQGQPTSFDAKLSNIFYQNKDKVLQAPNSELIKEHKNIAKQEPDIEKFANDVFAILKESPDLNNSFRTLIGFPLIEPVVQPPKSTSPIAVIDDTDEDQEMPSLVPYIANPLVAASQQQRIIQNARRNLAMTNIMQQQQENVRANQNEPVNRMRPVLKPQLAQLMPPSSVGMEMTRYQPPRNAQEESEQLQVAMRESEQLSLMAPPQEITGWLDIRPSLANFSREEQERIVAQENRERQLLEPQDMTPTKNPTTRLALRAGDDEEAKMESPNLSRNRLMSREQMDANEEEDIQRAMVLSMSPSSQMRVQTPGQTRPSIAASSHTLSPETAAVYNAAFRNYSLPAAAAASSTTFNLPMAAAASSTTFNLPMAAAASSAGFKKDVLPATAASCSAGFQTKGSRQDNFPMSARQKVNELISGPDENKKAAILDLCNNNVAELKSMLAQRKMLSELYLQIIPLMIEAKLEVEQMSKLSRSKKRDLATVEDITDAVRPDPMNVAREIMSPLRISGQRKEVARQANAASAAVNYSPPAAAATSSLPVDLVQPKRERKNDNQLVLECNNCGARPYSAEFIGEQLQLWKSSHPAAASSAAAASSMMQSKEVTDDDKRLFANWVTQNKEQVKSDAELYFLQHVDTFIEREVILKPEFKLLGGDEFAFVSAEARKTQKYLEMLETSQKRELLKKYQEHIAEFLKDPLDVMAESCVFATHQCSSSSTNTFCYKCASLYVKNKSNRVERSITLASEFVVPTDTTLENSVGWEQCTNCLNKVDRITMTNVLTSDSKQLLLKGMLGRRGINNDSLVWYYDQSMSPGGDFAGRIGIVKSTEILQINSPDRFEAGQPPVLFFRICPLYPHTNSNLITKIGPMFMDRVPEERVFDISVISLMSLAAVGRPNVISHPDGTDLFKTRSLCQPQPINLSEALFTTNLTPAEVDVLMPEYGATTTDMSQHYLPWCSEVWKQKFAGLLRQHMATSESLKVKETRKYLIENLNPRPSAQRIQNSSDPDYLIQNQILPMLGLWRKTPFKMQKNAGQVTGKLTDVKLYARGELWVQQFSNSGPTGIWPFAANEVTNDVLKKSFKAYGNFSLLRWYQQTVPAFGPEDVPPEGVQWAKELFKSKSVDSLNHFTNFTNSNEGTICNLELNMSKFKRHTIKKSS